MISNLEYYRAFFFAANFSNITKAAEQLCLTQSAVSQAIKKLEDELKCSLFIRSPHGLSFTTEGEMLYKHIKAAFDEFEIGEQELEFYCKYESNELKIGAAETALYVLNGPVPSIFKKYYPDVHITFNGAATADTCQKLQNGEVEIAFLLSPIPDEYQFDLYKLIDIQDIFVASERIPLDFEKKHRVEEIIEYPLILPPPEASVRQWIDRCFMKKGIKLHPDYTIRSTSLTLSMLNDVGGVTILPEPYVRDNASALKLQRIELEEELPVRTLYLAVNSRRSISNIAHKFIEIVLS